jgi:hypothetical protein
MRCFSKMAAPWEIVQNISIYTEDKAGRPIACMAAVAHIVPNEIRIGFKARNRRVYLTHDWVLATSVQTEPPQKPTTASNRVSLLLAFEQYPLDDVESPVEGMNIIFDVGYVSDNLGLLEVAANVAFEGEIVSDQSTFVLTKTSINFDASAGETGRAKVV